MEIQLQELIDQIKKDGVQAAEAQAASILAAAEAEAKKIIAAAEAEADKMIENAKTENQKTVKAGEDALRQAGRNLLLSFRESVARELKSIIGDAVTGIYSSEDLAKLIVSAVESWTGRPEAEELCVFLNESDLAKLEDALLAALKEKLSGGVMLKANDHFDGGFRIAVNNGTVYYDYSAEAVTDMLSAYLSPRVTALLKEAE